ncbi:concanavalin A-like lectin/glucanase domain-containing protein [Schizothecium vesticola]|uniref:Concanavalin A-like lectin/glucanase domain-containing protein n=1 Tax=Schizothecium vesticola TaxID=314040 RepID=A0AA40EE84_9PEZI|nr:concanavalin A-like lectin/glucanase domain-containing protein [Schizothecium vesticola]
MRFSSRVALVASLLSQAQAQYLINDLSFGYGARIAPEGTYTIPNFGLQGKPNVPELLSNKLILTPTMPGNQRGAVWADKALQHQSWITDVEFRANGPERGAGNMNIWLVKEGPHAVGASSIYTVGKFEGLALVIDQYGGSGGMLRAFLNDGTADYKASHNVDALAFAHCNFHYRNLGRPSQVKLRHNDNMFIVEIDGHVCISSDQVHLPTGYHFGITAASADNPDSFEVFKLVTLTEDQHHQDASSHPEPHAPASEMDHHHADEHERQVREAQAAQKSAPHSGKLSFGRAGQAVLDDPFDTAIPDADATSITSSAAQFADLHNRIQSVNHHLSTIFRSLGQSAGVGEQRHAELSAMLGDFKATLAAKLDRLESIDNRVREMEKEMRTMRNDLAARLRESENSIKYHVSDKHESLADHVVKHAPPGHARLIFVIVGGQALLVGAFVWYKRRKQMPKKYL